MTLDEVDRTGLIRESYRIEGITPAECRSIFLDWALGLADTVDARDAIPVLLNHYGRTASDHPMTEVLTAGLRAPSSRQRCRTRLR